MAIRRKAGEFSPLTVKPESWIREQVSFRNNKRQRKYVAVGAIRIIMKTIMRSIIIASVALLMSAAGVRAVDWSDNLYLNTDVGSALQQNTQFHLSGWPTTQDATFNPGVRADIDLGYKFDDTWAVEFETGVIWNSIDSIGGFSVNGSFDIYTIPLLANVIYKFPTGSSWTPYVGMGVGGVVSIADFSNATSGSSDTCFTFAYQAEAGLKYALTKNISIGVAYKYFNTLNQRWFFSNAGSVKFDGVHIHAIVASFTWTF